MGKGLTEMDAKAQGDAIAILRAAGYNVESIGDVKPSGDGGVQFDLHVHAATRLESFHGQVEAMKLVAEDRPDVDMLGNPVEEDPEDE